MEQQNKYLVILIIVTGLMGLYFLFDAKPLLYSAIGLGLISILSSFIADKIVWVWDKIALILGTINSKILLSLIFYIFLFPIAIISRLFKRDDDLMLKKRVVGTYFKERNYTYVADDLKNVF